MGYLTARVLDSEKYGQLALGIGATVPFGLAVDYDPNWVGRYDSLRSELRTLDYGFSAAYKWQFISVGAGFDAQYSSAVLSNAIDFGLLGFANHIPGFAPGNADGSVRLEGSDVSYGFNVGGIVEYLQPGWVPGLGLGKLGVSYRSGITQDLSGRATFRNVPAVFSEISTAFQGQNAEATLKLPEVYNFSVAQDFLHHFTLLGTLTWTRWGRLQAIPISFSNPATEASLVSNATLNTPGIATNYKDAFRYSGGLEYRLLNDRLTLRVGGGYDETPVPDETVRSSRVPDGDRILVSTGLKYHVLDFNSPIFRARVGADVEIAYLHEFVSTEPAHQHGGYLGPRAARQLQRTRGRGQHVPDLPLRPAGRRTRAQGRQGRQGSLQVRPGCNRPVSTGGAEFSPRRLCFCGISARGKPRHPADGLRHVSSTQDRRLGISRTRGVPAPPRVPGVAHGDRRVYESAPRKNVRTVAGSRVESGGDPLRPPPGGIQPDGRTQRGLAGAGFGGRAGGPSRHVHRGKARPHPRGGAPHAALAVSAAHPVLRRGDPPGAGEDHARAAALEVLPGRDPGHQRGRGAGRSGCTPATSWCRACWR